MAESTDFESKARAALEAINDVAALHRKHGKHPLAITTEEARVRELESRLRAQDRESLERAARHCEINAGHLGTLIADAERHGRKAAAETVTARYCWSEAARSIRALASEPDAGTEGRLPCFEGGPDHGTLKAGDECPGCGYKPGDEEIGVRRAPSTAGSAGRREATVAEEAIDLFLEYRDQHDCEEPVAKAMAICEFMDADAALRGGGGA